jgi:hypothetical protein
MEDSSTTALNVAPQIERLAFLKFMCRNSFLQMDAKIGVGGQPPNEKTCSAGVRKIREGRKSVEVTVHKKQKARLGGEPSCRLEQRDVR